MGRKGRGRKEVCESVCLCLFSPKTYLFSTEVYSERRAPNVVTWKVPDDVHDEGDDAIEVVDVVKVAILRHDDRLWMPYNTVLFPFEPLHRVRQLLPGLKLPLHVFPAERLAP